MLLPFAELITTITRFLKSAAELLKYGTIYVQRYFQNYTTLVNDLICVGGFHGSTTCYACTVLECYIVTLL
jgi:hypothetical protein